MLGRGCPEATGDPGGEVKVGLLVMGLDPSVEPEPPLKRLLLPAMLARPSEDDSSVK
jgi:hypothetical protein